jgi:type II secretory pathway pseudopilin PulG
MRYLSWGVAVVVIFLTVGAWAVQNPARTTAPGQAGSTGDKRSSGAQGTGSTKSSDAELKWLQELLADRELMAELGQLFEKLQKDVHYPSARNESKILPRLPESTVFYGAYPNYGDTVHQAAQIFERSLRQSPHLSAFLAKNKLDVMETKVEDVLEKVYELSQFLSDEVVIEGQLEGKEPSGFLIARIKKPGLREYLEKLNNEWITNKADRLTILDTQQLAAAKVLPHAPTVLIRPDVVIIGFDGAALQEFSSRFDEGGAKFISSRLGQQVAQAYQGGTNSVLGVDLHKLISSLPQGRQQDRMMLEKSGLADVDYLLMTNVRSANEPKNEFEVIFKGPRRGIASWIASAGPMGGLDFVSTNTASAGDIMLKKPAEIYDELQDIAGENAFAGLRRMEMQLNLSLKYDLLSKLDGEVAFESKLPNVPGTIKPQNTFAQNDLVVQKPMFKIILKVNDAVGLQRTLDKLLPMAPVQAGQWEENGVTFHTLTTPAAASTEITYFFLDGYMVIASDRAGAREALEVHRSGHSLAKSSALRETIAQAHSGQSSVVFYQDPSHTWGQMMMQLPPEMRSLFAANASILNKPTVLSIVAEESSFRATTNSSVPADASVMAIVAAVAIPNLLRSRQTANEAVALSLVRTINRAQADYMNFYPSRGYAPNLVTLGGENCSEGNRVAGHACLLDEALGNGNCTGGKWCEKSGYKFSVRGVCLQEQCPNYAVTAVPTNPGAGGKSYCSASDGIVRSQVGPAPENPVTVSECKKWATMR